MFCSSFKETKYLQLSTLTGLIKLSELLTCGRSIKGDIYVFGCSLDSMDTFASRHQAVSVARFRMFVKVL